MGAVAKINFL